MAKLVMQDECSQNVEPPPYREIGRFLTACMIRTVSNRKGISLTERTLGPAWLAASCEP